MFLKIALGLPGVWKCMSSTIQTEVVFIVATEKNSPNREKYEHCKIKESLLIL